MPPLLITYSLFSHRAAGEAKFESFLGESDYEALIRAQEIMAGDAGVERVDVHRGEAHLFSVGAPP